MLQVPQVSVEWYFVAEGNTGEKLVPTEGDAFGSTELREGGCICQGGKLTEKTCPWTELTHWDGLASWHGVLAPLERGEGKATYFVSVGNPCRKHQSWQTSEFWWFLSGHWKVVRLSAKIRQCSDNSQCTMPLQIVPTQIIRLTWYIAILPEISFSSGPAPV